jgi:hypothetical protein
MRPIYAAGSPPQTHTQRVRQQRANPRKEWDRDRARNDPPSTTTYRDRQGSGRGSTTASAQMHGSTHTRHERGKADGVRAHEAGTCGRCGARTQRDKANCDAWQKPPLITSAANLQVGRPRQPIERLVCTLICLGGPRENTVCLDAQGSYDPWQRAIVRSFQKIPRSP